MQFLGLLHNIEEADQLRDIVMVFKCIFII